MGRERISSELPRPAAAHAVLHVLHLGLMALFHLLRLLLMALLHLLMAGIVCLLLLHPGMLAILLLLQLLMFFHLLVVHLLLLFRVLLIHLRVARIWSFRAVHWRQILRMHVVGVRSAAFHATVLTTAIFAARFPCGDNVRSAEFSRTLGRRYRRLAMIFASTKCTVAPRRIAIAHLGRYRLHMTRPHCRFLLRCRAGVDTALAAVIAHV